MLFEDIHKFAIEWRRLFPLFEATINSNIMLQRTVLLILTQYPCMMLEVNTKKY